MKTKSTKQRIPFTQVSNNILNNPNLSLKAKGIYAFMYSKPDDWNFTTRSMSSQLKEGRGSIMSAINELKDEGYVRYVKHQDGTGEYHFVHEEIVQGSKNTPSENTTVQKPDPISNTDLFNNKDISNKPQTPKGDSFNFSSLLETINEYTGRDFEVINKGVQRKFDARLKDGYSKQTVLNAIKNASVAPYHKESGSQYLTPEFFSRASTLDKWGSAAKSNKGDGGYIPTL